MATIVFCVIVCLGEVDYKEIGDCVHVSGYSSTDLCLPALDYLRKCSQVGPPRSDNITHIQQRTVQ